MEAITQALRAQISALAKEFFKNNTEVNITKFNTAVLLPNKIDYKLYATKLTPFLEKFPEILYIRTIEVGGGRQKLLSLSGNYSSQKATSISETDPDILTKYATIFESFLRDTGRCYLAKIQPVLKNEYGIDDYKKDSRGRKLSAWINEDFSDMFKVDGDYLLYSDTAVSLHDEASLFNSIVSAAWFRIQTHIQNYTEEQKSMREWQQDIARGFAAGLIGKTALFRYAVNGEQKLVFNTGIKNKANENIYGIVCKNSSNELVFKNKLLFQGVCCISDEDSPLSAELKQNVPEISLNDNALEDKYSELKGFINTLIVSRKGVLDGISKIQDSVNEGRSISADFYGDFKKYYDGWRYAKDIIEYLGWNDDTDTLTIDTINERLERKNQKSDSFNKARNIFIEGLICISKYCEKNHADLIAETVLTDIETVRNSTETSYDEFKALTDTYSLLMTLTEQQDLDSAVDILDKLAAYYKVRPLTISMLFLDRSAESIGLENKSFAKQSSERLDLISTVSTTVMEDFDETRTDPEGLFERVATQSSSEEFFELLYYVRSFPKSPLESALVLGEYSKCRSIIENHPSKTLYGKTKDELYGAIAALEHEKNDSATLFACGSRLYRTIGNGENRTAERYFIMGLISNTRNCSNALAEIYLDRGDAASFCTLWDHYSDVLEITDENFAAVISALGKENVHGLKEYLDGHLWNLYLPLRARIVEATLKDLDLTDLLDEYQPCLSNSFDALNINDFERTVLKNSGDDATLNVKNYITESTIALEELGYTRDEQDDIIDNLIFGEVYQQSATGEEVLYKIQYNRNRTVEAMIWNGLSNVFNMKNCEILMQILNSEGRFLEVVHIYGSYELFLEKSDLAREFYIIASIKTGNTSAIKFIFKNMQDGMRLIANGNIPADEFTAFLSKERGRIEDKGSLYNIETLTECLKNPILSSIITLSSELREFAVNTEKLEGFGLNKKAIENFEAVYRNDTYTHERSILDISRRIYSFIGTFGDYSRNFAWASLDFGYDAYSMLLRIFLDAEDTKSQLELMLDYPEAIEGREELYGRLLLAHDKYDKFLSEVKSGVLTKTPTLTAQIIIAKCKTEASFDDELNEIAEGRFELPAYWLVAALEAITENNIQRALDFLVNGFEQLLSLYSADELAEIITVGGKIDETALLKLQKTAWSEGCKSLAVYISETLGIKNPDIDTDAFLNSTLDTLAGADEDISTATRSRLMTLYSGNPHLNARIALYSISRLLEASIEPETLTASLEAETSEITLSRDNARVLLDILGSHSINLSEALATNIIKICRETELVNECIEYLNLQNVSGTFDDHDTLNKICELYCIILRRGEFEFDRWFENAEEICTKLLKGPYFMNAALCMYLMQKAIGNLHFMRFSAFSLLERTHEISEDILDILQSEPQLSEILEKNVFDLFVDMASNSSVEEIISYCHFCKKYSNDKVGLFDRYLRSQEENGAGKAYTTEESSIVLKLLYSNPENADYWFDCIKLPLEENPIVHTKILYITSPMINKFNLWKKCLDYCERYCREELLNGALISCAEKIRAPYDLQDLRTHLANKINANPYYFSQLDAERLPHFIETLCSKTYNDTGARENHGAIREISAVAVATDSVEAFDIMMRYFGSSLFGLECDLGFAIACRLITRKRYEEARNIIGELAHAPAAKYHRLIEKLSRMSAEELAAWGAESANQSLIELILPDGNYPLISQINEFALTYMLNGNAEEGATVLCEILENNPHDYGCNMALFMLCKELPGRLNFLHKAVCGLVRNDPSEAAQSFYTRTRKDFAVMLARLNPVITVQNRQGEISDFDGYDFNISAKDFFRNAEHSDNLDDLNEIDEIQSAIENAFMNQTSAEFIDILSKGIFSLITGNWSDLLFECWNKKISLTPYILYLNATEPGLARSILRVAYSLPEDQQSEFIKWVTEQFSENSGQKETLKKQLYVANLLFDDDYYSKIPKNIMGGNILLAPFEEYSVFELCFKQTVSQIYSSSTTSIHTFPCAMLVCYLAYSPNALSEFRHAAMENFEVSNDAVAHDLFRVLYNMWKNERMSQPSNLGPSRHVETIESMLRITGSFLGKEEVCKYISQPSFNPWSCINMVMALLYTKRANEIMYLKGFFDNENQQLVDTVMCLISKINTDAQKIECINAVKNNTAKGIFFYFLKVGHKILLKESGTLNIALQNLEEIAAENPAHFTPKGNPRHHMLFELYKIHKNAYSQIEVFVAPTEKSEDYDTVETIPDDTEISFSFVGELEAITTPDKTLEELWYEHENNNYISSERNEKCLELSEKMYRTAMGASLSAGELKDYALRYGADYCRYYCAKNANNHETSRILIEMMRTYNPTVDSEGNKMLKMVVRDLALYHLLNRNYENLLDLVEDYGRNKQAFIQMRNILAKDRQPEVTSIYASFDILLSHLNRFAETYSDDYLKALVDGKSKLSGNTNVGWGNLTSRIIELFQNEINRVNHRPRLRLEIFSKKSGNTDGFIFGQVKNVGGATAENISMQIEYGNKVTSETCTMSKLATNETATFKIRYSVDPETVTFNYNTNILYRFGEDLFRLNETHILKIEDTEFTDPGAIDYHTGDALDHFEVLEDGTVYHKFFFGRDEEKRRVNSLLSGDSILDYSNIIVKGIRRAGKTTFLNYIMKCAEVNCKNVMAVKSDCLNVSTIKPIQTAFVDQIIKKCKERNTADMPQEMWNEFEHRWSLSEDELDRNISDLPYFFRDLQKMNGGKGLLLVIDEFDVLIEAIESIVKANNIGGIDNFLFSPLRAMLLDKDCKSAMRIVVCGSTKLIRYINDGATYNQFFQQFGNNVINIGRLLERDIQEMLNKPCAEKVPPIKITTPAMSWIWKISGGLAWYSKLLTAAAIDNARSENRSIVYPSDVVEVVINIVSNELYLKELPASCTDNELTVLKAIQRLSYNVSDYVSLKRLTENFKGVFTTKDIENITGTLENLQIIKRNPNGFYSYKFAVELYWYFFEHEYVSDDRDDHALPMLKPKSNYVPTPRDDDY